MDEDELDTPDLDVDDVMNPFFKPVVPGNSRTNTLISGLAVSF